MLTVQQLIRRDRNDYDIGYRYLFQKPVIGDRLPHSETAEGTQLRGTCAFASRDGVQEYAKHSTGWIVMLRGVRVGTHDDLPGEILIDEAEVIAIWGRRLPGARWWRIA